jgi:hypothetical protein
MPSRTVGRLETAATSAKSPSGDWTLCEYNAGSALQELQRPRSPVADYLTDALGIPNGAQAAAAIVNDEFQAGFFAKNPLRVTASEN